MNGSSADSLKDQIKHELHFFVALVDSVRAGIIAPQSHLTLGSPYGTQISPL